MASAGKKTSTTHSHSTNSNATHATHKTEKVATNGHVADHTERAEELVDHLGERFGNFLSTCATQLNRWTARAREEAEDIVAEAQSLRHRGHSSKRNGKR